MTVCVDEKVDLVLQALHDAKDAVDFRRSTLASAFRKSMHKRISSRQFAATEKELTEALIPFFVEQGRSMAKRLREMGGRKAFVSPDSARGLVQQAFRPREWRGRLANVVLPVLARRMGEAAVAHLLTVGVDVRRKKTKTIEASSEKYNPNRDEHGRFAEGGGRFSEGAYKEARAKWRKTKGTDHAVNRELIKASGVSVSAPKDLENETIEAVAHVVADSSSMAKEMSGIKVDVVSLKTAHGKSKGKTLLLDSETLRTEGPGFGAAVVRHELEHTRLTKQGVPSGQQEQRVRYASGTWSVLQYSMIAKTNPAAAAGFKKAANLQGVRLKASTDKYHCPFADLDEDSVQLPNGWKPLQPSESKSFVKASDAAEWAVENLTEKYNPNRDEHGRFAPGSGGDGGGGTGRMMEGDAGEFRMMPDGGIEWVPAESSTFDASGVAKSERAAEVYETANESLRAAAERTGLKEMHVVDDESMDQLTGRGKGSEKQSNAYVTDDGELYMRDLGEDKASQMKDTLHHELAHAVDPMGADGRYEVSESKEWLEASGWKRKGKGYGHSGKVDEVNPVSDYARKAPWEDFAETVRAYMSDDPMSRRVLQRFSPKRFEFVEKFLETRDVKGRNRTTEKRRSVDEAGFGSRSGEVFAEWIDVSQRREGGHLGRRSSGVQGKVGPGVERGVSIKASSAAEWVEENAPSWESLEEAFVLSGESIGILNELPEWMKSSIAERLMESFSEDYWDAISETTMGDAERVLREGVAEGESISDMAVRLRRYFEDGGFRYARARSENIARTESANALNGARKDSVARLQRELGPQVPIKQSWLSVLGNTTRATHANLDGVPEDEKGMWNLSGYEVPWPGHTSLPAAERCNCQCTLTIEFGMREDEAQRLIGEYQERVKTFSASMEKYNPNRDEHGRFAPGSGGGGDTSGRVFHGTSSDVIESIFENGIVSPGGPEGRTFEEQGFYEGPRKGAVFVSTDESMAEYYAENSLNSAPWSAKPAVLTIEIPKGAKLKVDEADAFIREMAGGEERFSGAASGQSYFMKNGIPSSWIRSVSILDGEGNVVEVVENLNFKKKFDLHEKSTYVGLAIQDREASFFVESTEKYNPNRDEHGRFAPGSGGGSSSSSRSERAKRTHKPSTAEKQRRGESEQARMAKVIGGENTDDNRAFDVLVGGRHAIEVKTVIDNDNDKITMHPESRRRKESYAKDHKVKSHTVVIDVRGGRRSYYYKKGVGAFRLRSMEKVSLSRLKEKFE